MAIRRPAQAHLEAAPGAELRRRDRAARAVNSARGHTSHGVGVGGAREAAARYP